MPGTSLSDAAANTSSWRRGVGENDSPSVSIIACTEAVLWAQSSTIQGERPNTSRRAGQRTLANPAATLASDMAKPASRSRSTQATATAAFAA